MTQLELQEHSKKLVDSFIQNHSNIEVTEDDIQRYTNLASFYNRIHTEFDVGDFRDRGNYEASFVSRFYIEDDLDFIINLFISHSNGHAFHNGNKRTATDIFIYFLNHHTPYKIKSYKQLIENQRCFVAGEISKEEFEILIKEGLIIKMIKKTEKVKLEKLIKRGSVTEGIESNNQRKQNFTLKDLKNDDLFFRQLRKPYFQRDTNSWDVEKIEKLLNSYIENMLIPAVILWNSKNDGIFIVDGAHRVSALAAWVNDDYGKDIDYSKHLQVKEYIDSKIGVFDEVVKSEDPRFNQLQNTLAIKAVNIEWINGDYDLVKSSFIRINEQGVAITQDEKEIIKNDKTAVAQLSRSMLSFSGGQYSEVDDHRIEVIYDQLFKPKYDKASKTVPMCGNLYDDFLISRVFNLIKVIDDKKSMELDELLNKVELTIDTIVNQLEINNRVYFYGMTYQFKQSALVGITKFIMDLSDKNELSRFLEAREKFESYLVDNPEHIQTIVRRRRQVKNSIDDLVSYYNCVLEFVTLDQLDKLEEEFYYLGDVKKTERMQKIEQDYKSEINALSKCTICGGYLNNYSLSNTHAICSI